MIALPARAAVVGGFDFDRAQVSVTGLQVPWGFAFLPDGSALVTERNTARVMQVRPGQTPVAVATISGVSASGESGLLGIAVSPTYAQDQWIYVYFTTATDNRLARFRLSAPQTQNVLLSGIPRATIHDGGRIAFGPDGMLYLATGDARHHLQRPERELARREDPPDEPRRKHPLEQPDRRVAGLQHGPPQRPGPGLGRSGPPVRHRVRPEHHRRDQPDRAGRQLRLADL